MSLDRPGARRDAVHLSLLSLLVSAASLRGLGRYSDDWNFFRRLELSAGEPLLVRARDLFGAVTPRPGQSLLHPALHSILGDELVAYYALLAGLTLGATLLLYLLTLRATRSRSVARPCALLFIVLPHATTARWWIASLADPLSLVIVLTALAAAQQAASAAGAKRLLWLAASGSGALLAALTYEVPLPLLALAPGLAALEARRHGHRREALRAAVTTTLAVGLPIVAAYAYKRMVTSRAQLPDHAASWIAFVWKRISTIGLVDLGVELPLRAVRAVGELETIDLLVAALVVALAIWATDRAIREEGRAPDRWLAPSVALAGSLVYLLGYGVAFLTSDLGLSALGFDNRTAAGALPGAALAFTGVLASAAALANGLRSRRVTFALGLILISSSGLLVTLATAGKWRSAARAQERTASAVALLQGRLPKDSTLLIDGQCPHLGPAPVFECYWDATAMVRGVLQRRDIRSDVVRPGTEARAAGLRTSIYGEEKIYAWSDSTFVFDIRSAELTPLDSLPSALAYFAAHPESALTSCPPSREGEGEVTRPSG